jgi:E3 ubiquitin-protein ligase TRIP12
MDRGRVGSLVTASKACSRKVWEREHDGHRDRIKKVKPATDMTVPVTASLDHIRNNLKKEQLLEGRYMEIDRENRILLRKMSEMMLRPNPYTKAPEHNAPASINKDGRKHELQRITKENQRLLKSIQDVQPVYSVKKWEQHHKETGVHLRNCCTYPVITRLPRNASSPSILMRMETAGGDGTTPEMPGLSSSAGDDTNYVLKEGKRIGETYYLVEMSTDGRTLSISAYDGDTQKSFELVVGEKNHRQLYREAQGDYSLIANKLRVENDRLKLANS